MNVLDAFYHTVHDFPGGSESLAPRLGTTPSILNNKADQAKQHNKPLLVDADSVMGITQDYRILRSMANKHGFLLVKAPDPEQHDCDMSVLEQVTGLMMEQGNFAKEIYDALADGGVSQEEMSKIERVGQQFMTAIALVKQRLQGMAD